MKHLLLSLLIGLSASSTKTPATKESETTDHRRTGSVNKQPIAASGIVFFSDDNGVSWQNKSQCLPENVFLTDIATSNQWLGVSTKQNGIFMYDFENENWEKTSGKPGTSADTDALFFFKNHLYAGTHNEGIFVSTNNGKNWSAINQGLGKLTIRRFAEIDNRLYVGTNDGLYVFDETKQKWQLEFGNNQLQVNGIIKFDEEIYIGTNQGVFKSPIDQNNWKHVLRDHSLHNISSANKSLYALVYNELYASKDKGASWYNDQRGMPSGKYSFQLLQKGRSVFVGQWDGIYTNDPFENWKLFNNGIPPNTPITEMNTYKSLLVAASPYWVKQR